MITKIKKCKWGKLLLYCSKRWTALGSSSAAPKKHQVTQPHNSNLEYCVPSGEAMGTVFAVFGMTGMTRPQIEPTTYIYTCTHRPTQLNCYLDENINLNANHFLANLLLLT